MAVLKSEGSADCPRGVDLPPDTHSVKIGMYQVTLRVPTFNVDYLYTSVPSGGKFAADADQRTAMATLLNASNAGLQDLHIPANLDRCIVHTHNLQRTTLFSLANVDFSARASGFLATTWTTHIRRISSSSSSIQLGFRNPHSRPAALGRRTAGNEDGRR